MPPIKHTQLFDFPAYSAAIKDVQTQTEGFGKSMQDLISRLAGEQKKLTASLGDYATIMKNMNVAQSGATDTLKSYDAQITKTIGDVNNLKSAQSGMNGILDANNASVKELKLEYAGLKKQYENLRPAQKDYADQVKNIKTQIDTVVPRLIAYSSSIRSTKNVVDAAEGSYRKMSLELGKLRTQLREMPGAFDSLTGKLNTSNPEVKKLSDRITTLDNTLKSADASMGNYARNVGNYAGKFNGLGNSINQLTREAPAFAVSLNTGFLALSNNLPILFDEIGKIKAQNVELAKSGEKTKSVFSQIGSAVFSFQTALSVGVTLLTLYGGKIFDWIGSLFKGKDAAEALAKSQETLNRALESSEYTNAITQLTELRTNVDLAKRGFISKDGVIKEYNESLGKTIGQARSLDEVERLLVAGGDAYVKMTLYKAAANLALEEAAKKAFAAEQSRRAPDKKFESVFDNLGPALTTSGDAAKVSKENERQRGVVRENRRKEEVSEAEKDRKVFEDIAKKFQEDAAKISKDNKFDFFGDYGDKKGPKKSDQAAKDRIQAIRDQQDLLKKLAELEEVELQRKFNAGEIFERDYQEKKLAINKDYLEKSIVLENTLGKDADKVQIADFKKTLAEQELEYEKFVRKQAEIDRQRSTPRVGREDVGTITGGNTAKPFNAFMGSAKDIAKYYDDVMKAENRMYALVGKGRDTSFRDQITHLEKMKKLNEDASKAIGIKNVELSEKYAEQAAEIEVAIQKRKREQMFEIVDASLSGIRDINGAYEELLQAQSDARIQKLETEKAREIELAGNNTAAKEKIEKDYNKKIAAEKTKMAKASKRAAYIDAIINTALGITSALRAPWPLSIIFAALAGAMGALQIATIASQPLPTFKKGTKNAPKGPAITGEEGFEIIDHGNDRFSMTQDGPGLTMLQGGEKIYTHAESKRMLAATEKANDMKQLAATAMLHGSLSDTIKRGREKSDVDLWSKAMRANITEEGMQRAMERALKNLPIERHSYDERGYRKHLEEKNSITTYLNELHSLK